MVKEQPLADQEIADEEISPAVAAALEIVPQKHGKLFQRFLSAGFGPGLVEAMQGSSDIVDPESVKKMQEFLDFLRNYSPEALGCVLLLVYLSQAKLINEKFGIIGKTMMHAIGIGGSFGAYYYLEHPERIGPDIHTVSNTIRPFINMIIHLVQSLQSLG